MKKNYQAPEARFKAISEDNTIMAGSTSDDVTFQKGPVETGNGTAGAKRNNMPTYSVWDD